MSQEEFKEQYALASAQVETWPAWKRNILDISSSPTVAVPRQPVDNSRAAEVSAKPPQHDE